MIFPHDYVRSTRRKGTCAAEVTASKPRQAEATVIENVILGAFLVIPLVIVAVLFSDELWQDHRMNLQYARPRRRGWRDSLRRMRHPRS
jgi:hypothetical protein